MLFGTFVKLKRFGPNFKILSCPTVAIMIAEKMMQRDEADKREKIRKRGEKKIRK